MTRYDRCIKFSSAAVVGSYEKPLDDQQKSLRKPPVQYLMETGSRKNCFILSETIARIEANVAIMWKHAFKSHGCPYEWARSSKKHNFRTFHLV